MNVPLMPVINCSRHVSGAQLHIRAAFPTWRHTIYLCSVYRCSAWPTTCIFLTKVWPRLPTRYWVVWTQPTRPRQLMGRSRF